jgi:hypothetical protein
MIAADGLSMVGLARSAQPELRVIARQGRNRTKPDCGSPQVDGGMPGCIARRPEVLEHRY